MARYLFVADSGTTILEGKSLSDAAERYIETHPECTEAYAYRIAGGVRVVEFLSVTEQKVIIK